MIYVYEKLSYFSFTIIIFNKFTKQKKTEYFYIDNCENKIVDFLNKNIFLIKKLKWDLISIKDDKNSSIENYIEDELLNTIINNIILSIPKKNTKSYFSKFILFRILKNYKLLNTDKNIQQYLILIYSIYSVLHYKNKTINLYISKVFCSNEFSKLAKNLNINLKLINNFSFIKKLKQTIKYLIFSFIFTTSLYKKKLFKKYYHFSKKYDELIVIDLPLQMNNPIHFFQNCKIKNNFLLINRFTKLTEYEKNQIKKSNVKLYNFPQSKNYNIHNYLLTLNNPYSYRNTIIKNTNRYLLCEKLIWKNFFLKNKTFIYYHNGLGYNHSIAACSAISDIGGVSIYSQTSFHDKKNLDICSDIFFTFSPDPYNLMGKISSNTKYLIKAGYVHDYNFKIFQKKSKKIRNDLLNKGVKKIIAYYDQGHSPDSRFEYGYYQSSIDYEYILNKLLVNDWIGLIIKPKKPLFLNDKINRIKHLFNKALETGRLHINLETQTESAKDFENPPCVASMASDISVHVSPKLSATAGIESYLTNTPTIFLDKTFTNNSSIKNSNNEILVFNNWDDLWLKLENYLLNDQNKKIFGNLNYLINKVDSFRDGQASLRILNFLNDLNSNRNLENKSKIIEYTVNKYADKWGSDKIIKI